MAFKDKIAWVLGSARKWFSKEPDADAPAARLPHHVRIKRDHRARLQRRKVRNAKARKEAIKNGALPRQGAQRRHSKPLGRRQRRNLGLIGKPNVTPNPDGTHTRHEGA